MFYTYVREELETYCDNIQNTKLRAIIQYSLKDGKCIRSYIVKHLMETLSGVTDWRPICSIEMIHGASLILDDLPCMDNDIERRGKDATWVKFGERTSILASFYIVSETFKLLIACLNDFENQKRIDKTKLNDITIVLTDKWTTLIQKLLLGQMLDLKEDVMESLGVKLSGSIDNIIVYKTCSLFSLTFLLGALYSCKDLYFNDFIKMGYYFGIMFQIMDDFKDKEDDEAHNNYVNSKGCEQTIDTYNKCKVSLIILLDKYEIHTNEFDNIISIIDKITLNNQ